MSLSISGNDPTSRLAPTSDEPKKTEENAKKTHDEFDFSGAAYSALHIPTGLMSGPPTKAQIKQDLKDTVESGKKVLEDLKSPELRELIGSATELGFHTAKFSVELAELVEHGAEACEGSPSGLALAIKDGLGATASAFEIAKDTKDFKHANTPEARAKLSELVHDLEAFGKNAAKLHADLPKFAVTAPVMYAMGRI